MAKTAQVRAWWGPSYECAPSKYSGVAFPGLNRTWLLPVAAPSKPLWVVFARIMSEERYLFLESAGGTYNCRPPSLHAMALAIDLNPSKNPYRCPMKTNMPDRFVNRIKSIRANGKQAFMWGGDWPCSNPPDPMHWQINVAPEDIKNITYDGGQMTDHKHDPMPEDLPRDWADDTWKTWVAASGTDPKSRTWDFYREDLSWVYTRVIAPLEARCQALEERVRLLEQTGGGGVSEAKVREMIAATRLRP